MPDASQRQAARPPTAHSVGCLRFVPLGNAAGIKARQRWAGDPSSENLARAWHVSWARTWSRIHADQVLPRVERDAFFADRRFAWLQNLRTADDDCGEKLSLGVRTAWRGGPLRCRARCSLMPSATLGKAQPVRRDSAGSRTGSLRPRAKIARADPAKPSQLLHDVDDGYRRHMSQARIILPSRCSLYLRNGSRQRCTRTM